MNAGKNAGFSYIEVLAAVAILLIMLVPVLPALSQAHVNHRYAALRGQARGRAADLALKVRRSPDNALAIVQQMALDNDDFIYRVSLVPVSGAARHYTAGGRDDAVIPPPGVADFQTGSGALLAGGLFVMAEVFDNRGNLAGLSVSKVN